MNGLDTTDVVQVASELVIRAALRESRFLDEGTSLFDQVLLKVTTENDVDLSRLTRDIVDKAACFVSFEDSWAELR